jgi:hypothetical protein
MMVFRKESLDAEFIRSGFVTIPLLGLKEVDQLTRTNERFSKSGSGFHCTMFNPNSDTRISINKELLNIIAPKLDDVLLNFDALYGNFMVKEPGKESDWFVHQDWSYVDEDSSSSLAVWIPLVDLNEHNGAITVVPGSHRFLNKFRGPGVTDPFEPLHQIIRKKFGKPVYLKAGEAIFWHHRLLHFSPPNLTKEPRTAATVICVPRNQQVYHFWRDPASETQTAKRFPIDADFFMTYEIGKPPQGIECDAVIDSYFPSPDKNQLERFYREATGSKFDILSRISKHIAFFK